MQGEHLLAQYARRQAGVFSRSQATAAALTRRQIAYRLEQGVWQRSFPGVYRVASAPRSAEQRLWAASLWAGDGAVVSHRSADALWKLDEVTAELPELSVPTPFHKRHAQIVVRRSAVDDVDRRVTGVERTLFDLASMERCVDRYATNGRAGVTSARRLLRDVGTRPSESALEVRAARLLPVTHDDIVRRGGDVIAQLARAVG
jgi:predicted transcriptional regulator of viral defense system